MKNLVSINSEKTIYIYRGDISGRDRASLIAQLVNHLSAVQETWV